MANINPAILLEFATSDAQRETCKAVMVHGSNTKAATALGKGRRGVEKDVLLSLPQYNEYTALKRKQEE